MWRKAAVGDCWVGEFVVKDQMPDLIPDNIWWFALGVLCAVTVWSGSNELRSLWIRLRAWQARPKEILDDREREERVSIKEEFETRVTRPDGTVETRGSNQS